MVTAASTGTNRTLPVYNAGSKMTVRPRLDVLVFAEIRRPLLITFLLPWERNIHMRIQDFISHSIAYLTKKAIKGSSLDYSKCFKPIPYITLDIPVKTYILAFFHSCSYSENIKQHLANHFPVISKVCVFE